MLNVMAATSEATTQSPFIATIREVQMTQENWQVLKDIG